MRVRLDAGALARFLGHPEGFPRAPGDLSEDFVVPTLDVSAFLVSEQSAEQGYQVAQGRGIIRYKDYGSPAAGAEIFISVPAGEAWRALILRARLTTDATVATRYADLRLTNDPSTIPPANDFYRDGIVSGQAASLFWDYCWALGHGAVVNNTGNGRVVRPFPDVILLPGQRITTFTLNLQAGDAWSQVRLQYETL